MSEVTVESFVEGRSRECRSAFGVEGSSSSRSDSMMEDTVESGVEEDGEGGSKAGFSESEGSIVAEEEEEEGALLLVDDAVGVREEVAECRPPIHLFALRNP